MRMDEAHAVVHMAALPRIRLTSPGRPEESPPEIRAKYAFEARSLPDIGPDICRSFRIMRTLKLVQVRGETLRMVLMRPNNFDKVIPIRRKLIRAHAGDFRESI